MAKKGITELSANRENLFSFKSVVLETFYIWFRFSVGNEKECDTESRWLSFRIPINPEAAYKIEEEAVSCSRLLDRDLCRALIRPVQ